MSLHVSKLRYAGRGRFRLADYDPADTHGFKDKKDASDTLETDLVRMAELQDVLYAHNRWSVLLVLQAMDAAGKDGIVKHVMSGLNPQGCRVSSFKQPSAVELDHDYFWRVVPRLPAKGQIGIFNRSYYEEVLVARVHPEILDHQKIPAACRPVDMWERRYAQICRFEKTLTENGTVILKFFLHLSKDEQKRRFLERIERPEKNWKFSGSDLAERTRWRDYQRAYEAAIEATSTRETPWHVIPADRKWFSRAAVARVVVKTLEGLDLRYPTVTKEQRRSLKEARKSLLAEGS
ncbi:MAG: polyphosphate kinase 2 family protein [Verrucomicrobiia bacterium]